MNPIKCKNKTWKLCYNSRLLEHLCPLLCVRRIRGGLEGLANKGNFHLYVHPIEASSMVMAFHMLIQFQKTFHFVHFPLKAIPGTWELKYSGGLLNNLNKDMNLLTSYYLLTPLVAVGSTPGPVWRREKYQDKLDL